MIVKVDKNAEPITRDREHRSRQTCTYQGRKLSVLKPKDAPTVLRVDRVDVS